MCSCWANWRGIQMSVVWVRRWICWCEWRFIAVFIRSHLVCITIWRTTIWTSLRIEDSVWRSTHFRMWLRVWLAGGCGIGVYNLWMYFWFWTGRMSIFFGMILLFSNRWGLIGRFFWMMIFRFGDFCGCIFTEFIADVEEFFRKKSQVSKKWSIK